MPIILNHSNIEIQYNTGSNYIIETVKRDLYRKNEIVDTIVRDNIQTAPVTPIVSIQEGSNVYAIESYTYSGTANTADYTRVFPKNTVCDILIVGGGGGGGSGMGGGGGGGQLIYATNVNIPIGTYNILVGKGGAGGTTNNGVNGNNSTAFGATANGGGGGGGVGSWSTASAAGLAGGSGGGGGANSASTLQSAGTVTIGATGSILASALTYGNAGGTGKYDVSYGGGGGGGGAGGAGTQGNSTSKGNGGNGIVVNITGVSYYWAGGGGGAGWASNPPAGGGNGGLGGGGGGAFGSGSGTSGINGTGGISVNTIQPTEGKGADGANNTGSGGGAGTYNQQAGGKGGSGIVIIRYLLGTIPTNNFLTEPTINPSVLVADAYYPRTPSTTSPSWADNGYNVITKVSDAVLGSNFVYYLFNNIITTNPITGGDDHYHSQLIYNGTGNTYTGTTRFKTFAGIAISVDFGRSIYPKRMRIAPHQGSSVNLAFPKAFKIFASDDASCWNDNNHSSWTQIHDQTTTLTITNGQYTIVNFTANLPKYRYYTMVVLSLIHI
jgi:hypothetical protein